MRRLSRRFGLAPEALWGAEDPAGGAVPGAEVPSALTAGAGAAVPMAMTSAPPPGVVAQPVMVMSPVAVPTPRPAAQTAETIDLRALSATAVAGAATQVSALSANALPPAISVTTWVEQAALPGVVVRVASVTPAAQASTASDGLAVLTADVSGARTLQVAVTPAPSAQAQADAAVTLQDAVSILKRVAGQQAGGGAQAWPAWALQAADFDGNGAVTLADALGVLRHAVGQAAPRPAWVFFDRSSGSGTVAPALGGAAPVSTIDVDLAPGGTRALAGVLRGDVDGSLAAVRFGLQARAGGGWAVDTGHGDVGLRVGAGDLVLSVADGQAARLALGDVGVLRFGGGTVSIDAGVVDLTALGPGAGLAEVGALTVGAVLRLTATQWSAVFGGGAGLSGRGAGTLELVVTTPQEAQGLVQMLDGTAFALVDRPAVAVSVVVDAAHPQAASMAASIDATLRTVALPVSEAVGRYVPVRLSTGELLPAAPPTLRVEVQGGVVSFAGTADGTLFVQVDAQGRATFSRASSHTSEIAATDTVVTGLFTKSLVGVAALTLTLGPSDAAVQYVLNAPQAGSVVLRGSTGGGADEVVVRIADPRPGTYDGRTLHVDSAGLTASGDTLTFRFEESARNVLSKPFDNDAVTLTPSSHINAGFSRLKVMAGIVDASSVSPDAGGYLPPQKEWEVSSGVVLSLAQLQTTRGVVSPSGSGGLVVDVAPGEQAELESLLGDPEALELSGLTATWRMGGAVSDHVWTFPAAATDVSAVWPLSASGSLGGVTFPAGSESFLA
jgi:hypothetical protein